ncbi:T9SS type A sorting domain-containing protein, partial [Lacibacter luteus]|uniref:T9SS type A sorting domain-containing protein n=1 Tax=Lacibacter luteus TaxID=2508719 RepID=UPI0013E903E2
TQSRTICSNQLPYTWDGLTFDGAGTKTKTGLKNQYGCDSTATYNLSVNPTTSSTQSRTICSNQLPYTWDGLTFDGAGTKTKTGLKNQYGCDSTATYNLTVNPTTSSSQRQEICANQLPYTWDGLTFDAGGTKSKTGLINQYGCDSTANYTLVVNPLPVIVCSANPTLIDITSAAHSSQLDVDLSGNADTDPTHYTYSWTEDGAGSFDFSDIKNPVYKAGILDAGQTITFTVTVTNKATGCVSTSTCSVNVNSAGSCPEVPTSEVCNGSTNTYTAGRAPTANETWKWTVDNGATIVGADNGQSVTVTAGGQNFTLTLTVSYANTELSPTVCTYNVTVTPCGGYCTYTQGKYGNTSPACDGDGINGSGPAVMYPTVLDMIKAMLGVGGTANPLVVGSGSNTVTIPATATAAALLNKSMPGGGSARELLSGNCIADTWPVLPSCWTPGTNTATTYITKQGKINNVLLSQTITLGLNMRVSSGLTNFVLQAGTFATAKADGGCGSTIPKQRKCYYNTEGIWVVENEYTYKSISQSVIDALTTKGYDLSVGGLYKLANDALGNTDAVVGKEGGASLSDINAAVSAINEGFDECRISMGWNEVPCTAPPVTTKINLIGSGTVSTDITTEAVTKVTVATYPNPFSDKVNFIISTPVSGKAVLEVYSIYGQKLQTVYEGHLTAGRSQVVQFRPVTIPDGAIVYRLSIAGKQVTGKLINVKQ